MTPWFVATQPFGPEDGQRWTDYIAWSGLTQLKELVGLDLMLCRPVLDEIKDEYWPHIVNENFMLNFWVDFDFLMRQVAAIQKKNVLCVFRNPEQQPYTPAFADFQFLGYDVVDVHGDISALTNCGGFPDVFANEELSSVGLLTDYGRAVK